jgi:hypothetical protein
MGLDANIYAVGNISDAALERGREFLRERGIEEALTRSTYYEDERVEVHTLDRYYGPGYERGHWPRIFEMIVTLRAAFPDATVHYGSDSDDYAPEVDDERLASLWAHWFGPDWNSYREGMKEFFELIYAGPVTNGCRVRFCRKGNE